MNRPFKTRFAPSPTGRLHLGNVRTALFNYLLARAHHGVFLLRLEDSDAVRGSEKYAQAILDDLRWLGLDWDEGPEVGGAHGPYAQSQRLEIYRAYFEQLQTSGLAYPCFCTEHELAVERKTAIAAGRPPRYSGRCRALSREEVAARFARGMPATLRFRVPEGRVVEFEDRVRGRQTFQTHDIGDFVIRRSDGTPAFFFCNAVDDALMGVTLVLRGEDHLANTPRQILLLEALGLAVPDYAHLPLVVGASGAPLAKRSGSRSLEELRAEGYLPAAILNYLARLGHTYESHALLDLRALAAGFDLARVHRGPARYDEQQLRHWQRAAVMSLPAERLWAWAGEAVQRLVPSDKRDAFIEAIRPNVSFPGEAREWARVLFTDDFTLTKEAKQLVEHAPRKYFEHVLQLFMARPDDPALFGRDLPLPEGQGRAQAFRLLRAALTNSLHGPEFAQLYGLMSKERIARRLRAAARMVKSDVADL